MRRLNAEARPVPLATSEKSTVDAWAAWKVRAGEALKKFRASLLRALSAWAV